MEDIKDSKDIEALVNAFYGKIQQDPLLGPVFAEKIPADAWTPHLQTMYRFWNTQLLGEKEYQGNPFAKHRNLPIDTAHFTQWIKLFSETIDEMFRGALAATAKVKAEAIGKVFLSKILFERGQYGASMAAGSDL